MYVHVTAAKLGVIVLVGETDLASGEIGQEAL